MALRDSGNSVRPWGRHSCLPGNKDVCPTTCASSPNHAWQSRPDFACNQASGYGMYTDVYYMLDSRGKPPRAPHDRQPPAEAPAGSIFDNSANGPREPAGHGAELCAPRAQIWAVGAQGAVGRFSDKASGDMTLRQTTERNGPPASSGVSSWVAPGPKPSCDSDLPQYPGATLTRATWSRQG